ncbi:hypothetical protein WBP07_20260 (plasmid) [Novosphingobium sp. BL-8A]|uniref:hypothetical protein n=1 Tax=Novosphingobium sp. BL-8A TaxID=3127639 RepID=UPI0037572ED7
MFARNFSPKPASRFVELIPGLGNAENWKPALSCFDRKAEEFVMDVARSIRAIRRGRSELIESDKVCEWMPFINLPACKYSLSPIPQTCGSDTYQMLDLS